jgi:hypothetical protein
MAHSRFGFAGLDQAFVYNSEVEILASGFRDAMKAIRGGQRG